MINIGTINKALVKKILEHHDEFKWSLQGLGMLRTYLSDELRLHVWDAKFAVPNVSTLHTHPWHFHSFVVAGQIHQLRYTPCGESEGAPWMQQEIFCGEGGGLVEEKEAEQVQLLAGEKEIYSAGASYGQMANEIHSSHPTPGTVTIVEREKLADADHALIFWPVGEEWISAEPRPATTEEVRKITQGALDAWF